MVEKIVRRRVEIPDDVYREIEKSARYLHIPVTTYVTIVLADAARADEKGLRNLRLKDSGQVIAGGGQADGR